MKVALLLSYANKMPVVKSKFTLQYQWHFFVEEKYYWLFIRETLILFAPESRLIGQQHRFS